MKKVSVVLMMLVLISVPLLAHQEDTATKFRTGWSKYKGGDYKGAVEDLSAVIQRDPKHSEAHYWRGKAYAALGKYKEAVADFDEALKLNPDFSSAYVQRAEARSRLKDVRGAEADLAKAGEKEKMYKVLPPPKEEQKKHKTEVMGVSKVEKKSADVSKALANLEGQIKRKSVVDSEMVEKLSYACHQLREAFRGLGEENKVDDLEKQVDKLKPQEKLTPEMAEQMAQAFKGLQQVLEYVRKKDPKTGMTAAAYVDRGIAHYGKGDFDEAIQDYTKAIELNPKDARAYWGLGSARYSKDDFGGALEDWEKAVELSPAFKEELEPWIQAAQEKLGGE